MRAYIKAELLKNRHSEWARLMVIFPTISILCSVYFSFGNAAYYQMNQYNWWYMCFLPIQVIAGSIFICRREKRLKYRAVQMLPVSAGKIWIAKVVSCIGQIIVSGSSMGTVSLRDMLADSFVDVLLSKDGDGPDLFTWDGSEFDSFDCLDNRIQMVDESVCNSAKADVSGSSNTAKRTSCSAGKRHVYAAGTGKECDRSGNLTQYGIICPVDSYDSKMVSEEDGSRMGKIKKLVGSEFLKLKGTWIFWIHLGVPVAGAGLFLLYGVAAKREWQSVLEFYAETLAIVYPSVSAIICMQSVMQELKAGNFQNLLCVSTLRWSAVLRKILTLWILGLAASLLAFLLFGMGVWGTKAAWNLSVKEYLICGLILWITQAGIYLFWQCVSEVEPVWQQG